MPNEYDFGGYATRNDLRCADGLTIRKDAFKEQDGVKVPIVWSHNHDDPAKVLGHGILENREDGVYVYGKFNETESGKNAKQLVDCGDVDSLSIYANQLKKRGNDVLHGMIREVSLVLAGANPGARIDNLSFAHDDGEDYDDGEALIFNNDKLELQHADEPEKKEEKSVAENSEKTVKDVFDSLNEEQKNVVYYMIGQALEENGGAGENEEDEEMKQNAFDKDTKENTLSHDDMKQIVTRAKQLGSMKEAVNEAIENGVIAHAADDDLTGLPITATYGINNLNYLMPEYKSLNTPPEFIKRPDDWVSVVMNGVHHTPFSRIKSMFADITRDEARAKGYIKAHEKTEEVFTLLKRSTDPQTVYKKQKMDRDDIIDITDFDVVAWIKSEMRMMLDEEIARAILIGDGRSAASDDKIQETHIRPIWTDADLFTIKRTITLTDAEKTEVGDDEELLAGVIARKFLASAIRSRKEYRGSGNLTLFTTEDMVANLILLEDGIGRRIYSTETELANALRVRRIVTVPQMENLTDADGKQLMGLFVDLKDYNVGADKGGAVNMFDDFDIDYNQQKYLMETRCSGALIKPKSAIAVMYDAGESSDDSGNSSNPNT